MRMNGRLSSRGAGCRNGLGFLVLAPWAGLAVGCGAIDTPEGYIRVDKARGYDFKAVSARGNVIALSSRPNEDRDAGLTFWAEAVLYQKVDVDGMQLASSEPIKGKSGQEGMLFNFELGEGQAKTTYLVALYVTPSTIYTVEATGPTTELEKDMVKLRAAMTSFR